MQNPEKFYYVATETFICNIQLFSFRCVAEFGKKFNEVTDETSDDDEILNNQDNSPEGLLQGNDGTSRFSFDGKTMLVICTTVVLVKAI
ncbi:hypothetical protein WA026_018029 [Henosepilachna vigintioctopunctata]|uniref:Uncharacterized protein n=1 Tax=Henosepilachna vigintioctopunctata TaxID=420089 RepID=A0AAW1UMW2_9CUCU